MKTIAPNISLEIDKIDYFDKLFEKLDYHVVIIQNKTFENCSFKRCNFDNANLLKCRFIDCEFQNCTLNTIILNNTMFSGITNFDSSKLLGVNWPKSNWPNIRLSSPINFYTCDISHSSFFGLGLTNINIQECKVHDVDFREADLSSGNFTGSDFHQSIFIHTKLTGADFSAAINYNIDIALNDVKKAIFTFPEVVNLLHHVGIKINGWERSHNE